MRVQIATTPCGQGLARCKPSENFDEASSLSCGFCGRPRRRGLQSASRPVGLPNRSAPRGGAGLLGPQRDRRRRLRAGHTRNLGRSLRAPLRRVRRRGVVVSQAWRPGLAARVGRCPRPDRRGDRRRQAKAPHGSGVADGLHPRLETLGLLRRQRRAEVLRGPDRHRECRTRGHRRPPADAAGGRHLHRLARQRVSTIGTLVEHDLLDPQISGAARGRRFGARVVRADPHAAQRLASRCRPRRHAGRTAAALDRGRPQLRRADRFRVAVAIDPLRPGAAGRQRPLDPARRNGRRRGCDRPPISPCSSTRPSKPAFTSPSTGWRASSPAMSTSRRCGSSSPRPPTADRATGTAFPIGRWISTLDERPFVSEAQREAALQTPGFIDDFRTHVLSHRRAEPPLAACQGWRARRPDDPTPETAEQRSTRSLKNLDLEIRRHNEWGPHANGWGAVPDDRPWDLCGDLRLSRLPGTHPDVIWNVQTEADIIAGHSEITGDRFASFLRQLCLDVAHPPAGRSVTPRRRSHNSRWHRQHPAGGSRAPGGTFVTAAPGRNASGLSRYVVLSTDRQLDGSATKVPA